MIPNFVYNGQFPETGLDESAKLLLKSEKDVMKYQLELF